MLLLLYLGKKSESIFTLHYFRLCQYFRWDSLPFTSWNEWNYSTRHRGRSHWVGKVQSIQVLIWELYFKAHECIMIGNLSCASLAAIRKNLQIWQIHFSSKVSHPKVQMRNPSAIEKQRNVRSKVIILLNCLRKIFKSIIIYS